MNYYKRAIFCFVSMLIVMVVCGARVFVIATDEKLSEAAVNQSTRRVTIAQNRGQIFDCNGVQLTDIEKETVTVVFPCEQGIIALSEMLDGIELENGIKRLKKGDYVVVRGKTPLTTGGCEILNVPLRYGDTATHLLGYVDNDGHGLNGIEKGLDDVLYSDSGISILYSVDSVGRMLPGAQRTVDYGTKGGNVTLTIDGIIQKITQRAMENVSAGAAVVIDAESGEIRSMVSKPDYDRNNVAEYLTDKNSPLINRALYPYNVGSVFKPCLSVAALENHLEDYCYDCKGAFSIGDLTFKCNKSQGHGTLDLSQALAYSCNTYFYTLGLNLKADNLYKTAKLFRFGEALDLGANIVSQKGSITDKNKLERIDAAVVNLSIGQGDLLLSPIAISTMYSAIINDGRYYLPKVIKSTEKNGKVTNYNQSLPTVTMKKSTADIVKNQLVNALKNGTGKEAYVEGISAGGKTGTAQTGWEDNGRSILNGWFCGFYEGVTGKYVIVILKEDVKSGSADCAPIFKEIISQLHYRNY